MTDNEYLVLLDAQLQPLVQKYAALRRVSFGRTLTAMQNNIENCMDDADEIQKDMMALNRLLLQKYNVEPTATLKKEITGKYIAALGKISHSRING